MILAGVLKLYKEEMICDLAEYYGIYDYESHPPQRVAIFVKGLGQKSRIMNKIANTKTVREDILLTAIFDNLNWLLWSKTKDGQKNKNKPNQLLEVIFDKTKNDDINSFYSGKDFDLEREKILEKIKKGGNL